jgi:methanogenic corrinoid protein MtbC1
MISDEKKVEILNRIKAAIINFEEEECAKWCRAALAEDIDAYDAVMSGLALGMERVGELYTNQEYFVPELLLCSDALYAGLDILRPHLRISETGSTGKIILGVVEGDIHDIGKNLVKTMFEAARWEVYDLGKDVRCELFVEEQKKRKADVLGFSALMTTSMMGMEKAIGMVKAEDPNVKIIVGGAPLNSEIARKFGADGYAQDAVSAVKEARRLTNGSFK